MVLRGTLLNVGGRSLRVPIWNILKGLSEAVHHLLHCPEAAWINSPSRGSLDKENLQ